MVSLKDTPFRGDGSAPATPSCGDVASSLSEGVLGDNDRRFRGLIGPSFSFFTSSPIPKRGFDIRITIPVGGPPSFPPPPGWLVPYPPGVDTRRPKFGYDFFVMLLSRFFLSFLSCLSRNFSSSFFTFFSRFISSLIRSVKRSFTFSFSFSSPSLSLLVILLRGERFPFSPPLLRPMRLSSRGDNGGVFDIGGGWPGRSALSCYLTLRVRMS